MNSPPCNFFTVDMIYQIKGFYAVIKRNIHVEAIKIKQKKMKTKLTATPTLYGEDAKRVLEEVLKKPSEKSIANVKKLIEFFHNIDQIKENIRVLNKDKLQEFLTECINVRLSQINIEDDDLNEELMINTYEANRCYIEDNKLIAR